MSATEDVLYIAIGCSAGAAVLIAVVVAVCCFQCRRSKKNRSVEKYVHPNASSTGMPYTYSSDPKGSSFMANLGPSRAYLFYGKNPTKYANGGYPLRPASSETLLYHDSSVNFVHADRRLQHFLQRKEGSLWQVDVEDRAYKRSHEIRADDKDRRRGVARNASMTARIDIVDNESDGDDPSSSQTKLFTISDNSNAGHSGFSNTTHVSVPQVQPSGGVSRNSSFQMQSRSSSRGDEFGRYYVRPSYQHYDLRAGPFTSQQQIYVSNPNVYFSENPLVIRPKPWNHSSQTVGNIVLSPAATFSRPNSMRLNDQPQNDTKQRSPSQNAVSKNWQMNGGFDTSGQDGVVDKDKMKEKKVVQKWKFLKKSPEMDKNINQPIDFKKNQSKQEETTGSPPKDPEIDIYAVPNKKAKKKGAGNKTNDDPEVKLNPKAFLERSTKTKSSSSFTTLEVRADIENGTDAGAIYETVELKSVTPTSDKGYDTMDGKNVTAAAFKFLENYEDDRVSTGTGAKRNNELVPVRSEMSAM